MVGRGVLLAAVVLAMAMAATAEAQALYGSLLGNVTDETGAALPGATVTITQRETNLTCFNHFHFGRPPRDDFDRLDDQPLLRKAAVFHQLVEQMGRAIAAVFGDNRDPLFGGQPAQVFQRLHRRIANLVPVKLRPQLRDPQP